MSTTRDCSCPCGPHCQMPCKRLASLPAAPASQAPAVVPSDEQIEEIWDRVADELTQEQKMVPMFARALLALVGVTKEPEQQGHPNARSGQFTDAADEALKAFAEFVDKELDGRAPIWLWLARFKTVAPAGGSGSGSD